MSLIFISYRRGESAGYAGRLHESLERRLGDGAVFRDVDGLEPGQDFVDAIAARLRDCRACLILIGREWLDVTDDSGRRRLSQPNDYVRLEIEAALARTDLVVVPLLVEGITMPSVDELPDTIRALSRRHAMSLRDETWDADVDRLIPTLEKAIGRSTIPGVAVRPTRLPSPTRRTVLVGGGIALAMCAALFLTFLARDIQNPDPGSASNGRTFGSALQVGAPPQAIRLPSLVEAAHGYLIYTVLSGDVASGADGSIVRLRVRFSNEGSDPANFWDNAFRLAVQGHAVGPVGGLNAIVPGHALQQGVITFDAPRGAARASLHIVDRDAVAEIPLDLTPVGGVSRVDSPDSGDALSRADVVRLTSDPVTLASGKESRYTLVSLTVRRFVNVLRILVGIRFTNTGPDPTHLGAAAIRVMVDDQAMAPIDAPSQAVERAAAVSAQYTFDVPPTARRITVRVTDEPGAEARFDLPSLSQ